MSHSKYFLMIKNKIIKIYLGFVLSYIITSDNKHIFITLYIL